MIHSTREEIREIVESAEKTGYISKRDYKKVKEALRWWSIEVVNTLRSEEEINRDRLRQFTLNKEKINIRIKLQELVIDSCESDTKQEVRDRNFKIANKKIQQIYPRQNFMLIATNQTIPNFLHPEGYIVVETYYCSSNLTAIQIDINKRIYRVAVATDDDPIPPYGKWIQY